MEFNEPTDFSTLTPIGLDFFDIFRFGGGGDAAPLIIFVVCDPIATKFSTGVDNQSSNMEKNCIKLMASWIMTSL